MVIGNGLVAKAFKEYGSSEDYLIFASGVSNSKSGLHEDYQKEKALLENTLTRHPDKLFVYFSTCSIMDPDLAGTLYIRHKIEMEKLIRDRANQFLVFRLSNLAGHSKNRHTVLNFFNHQILHDLPFECWKNAERNIIDVEDVFRIAGYFLQKKIRMNDTINIANTGNYTVPYIVHSIELFHGKSAVIIEKEKGLPFKINVSDMLPVTELLGIRFGDNYLHELLRKYYS
jgi:nucleoside-diphosphate-sugar epimerase